MLSKMMTSHLLRVSGGLLAALLAAALLEFALFDLGALSGSASALSTLWASVAQVFTYGLPLSVLAVLATEMVRLRRVAVHIGLGIVITLVVADFATRGQTLMSPVFTGGTLAVLALLAIGALSGLAYWAVSGRYAGWRGGAVEREEAMAIDAFNKASANAQVEYCKECLAGLAALALLVFLSFGWIAIDATGLRNWFVDETQTQGNAALKSAGYSWASFRVDGHRGILKGLAPDEAQKRAAFDSVREALQSVTGFPGVLAQIENETVARMPMAAVSQQFADAARRESEAKTAVEEARAATESARAAEAESKRTAEERATAAETAVKRKLEEQARTDEETRLQAAAQPEKPAETQVEKQAQKQAAKPVDNPDEVTATDNVVETGQVASIDPAPQDEANISAGSPALEPEERAAPAVCTSQDLAMIESSRIHFAHQSFEITSDYAVELDRLAASAQACAQRPIQVSGYADTGDDAVFNPALGLQRAQSVREMLIARGVAATRVIAVSAGKSSSYETETRPAERDLNRRSEFRLLEVAELSRDATQGPDERATNCESDLSGIMAKSIIHFPSASSRISDESLALVKKLARAVQTCGSVIVTVEGHTDKIGTDVRNQGLSEARANSVREALVASGADPTRLAARGFASSRPYEDADTPEALALNRRIEFRVSGKFTSTNAGGP
jgi:outer membrane protein OmpA-like peptidoglycan-associated protein